jgi:hypothetical protein
MLVIELRKIVFLKDVGLVPREEVLIVILIWVSLFSSSDCKLSKLFFPYRHTFVHFCILAIPGHLFYHSEIFQNRYTCEKCSGTIFQLILQWYKPVHFFKKCSGKITIPERKKKLIGTVFRGVYSLPEKW